MKLRVIRMQLAEDGNQKVGVIMMDDVYSIQVMMWKPEDVQVAVGDEVEVDVHFGKKPAETAN